MNRHIEALVLEIKNMKRLPTEAEKRSFQRFKERLSSNTNYPKRLYLDGDVQNFKFSSMAIE